LRIRKVRTVLLVLVIANLAVTAAVEVTDDAVSLNEAKKVAEKFIAKISTTEDFRDGKMGKSGEWQHATILMRASQPMYSN